MVHASMLSVGGAASDLVRALLDPATAHAKLDHGVLAETIRTWPGALRSAHPARIPDERKRHYKRLMNGVFVDFEELDTCDPVHASLPDDYFGTIAREYPGSGCGRTGKVGGATSHLFDAPGVWRFGVEWLERRLA